MGGDSGSKGVKMQYPFTQYIYSAWRGLICGVSMIGDEEGLLG